MIATGRRLPRSTRASGAAEEPRGGRAEWCSRISRGRRKRCAVSSRDIRRRRAAFEARLRLARLLQIRADFESSEKPRAEAKRLLDELEKTATPEQRPELDFAKVARLMRGLRPPDAAQRDEVLKAARRFQAAHPADRRVAALLAEVATLFDSQPKTKEILLEDAARRRRPTRSSRPASPTT